VAEVCEGGLRIPEEWISVTSTAQPLVRPGGAQTRVKLSICADYERLPHVLTGFDVALMPFALNESTRSISPTKTLEYLAASLPVVSTRVPHVVAEHGSVVALANDAEGFAAECVAALRSDPASHRARVDALLRLHHWDAIAARMERILIETASKRGTAEPAAPRQESR
jgi:glycosyltransferase involved in cell wall biosynthesis